MLARNQRLWTDHLTGVHPGELTAGDESTFVDKSPEVHTGTLLLETIRRLWTDHLTNVHAGDLTRGAEYTGWDRDCRGWGRRSATASEDGQSVSSTSTRFTITP